MKQGATFCYSQWFAIQPMINDEKLDVKMAMMLH